MQTQIAWTMNKNLPQNSVKKHQKSQSLLIQTQTSIRTTTQKRTNEYSDDEQAPAVKYQRCTVMYSTEYEQEPAIEKFQKTSKIPKFVDTGQGTEDEQKPTIKQPQKE